MSHINRISIKNYRGIKSLTQDFGDERFIILIGRGDSGKSTILSAIYAALSPAWNMVFSDLDFYEQDTTNPIEIELGLNELPKEFLKESKYGLYLQNDLSGQVEPKDLTITIRLSVDDTLEPHWTVKSRAESDIDDKPISGTDRALLAVNFITDYTDNQFSYNRQSPLYALTKSNINSNTTIERVKSQLIRSMADAIDEKQVMPLNAPLESLRQTAEMLGLTVYDLHAQIDIKENPYTGNSIALHEGPLPYRLRGKGSKRLMSITIQSELTKQGGIVMVDELEQGLEPDRIVTLVRALKKTSAGQVFITTHSLNVILEANWNNLFILNKGDECLHRVNEELDACRRTNPQALFAKKIICCEGKTEQGFIRAIDAWLQKTHQTSFSAKGVVLVDAKGGDNMYSYSVMLKSLGYDTGVFADDDTASLESAKGRAINSNVQLFLCEEGNCLERQVIMDLPWEKICEIVNCDQEDFPHKNINLSADFLNRLNAASTLQAQKEMREEIITFSVSKGKEWFKHIPGGEFLGRIVMTSYENMQDAHLKSTIKNLLNWCSIVL